MTGRLLLAAACLAAAAGPVRAATFRLDAVDLTRLGAGYGIAAAPDGTMFVTGTYRTAGAPRAGVWRLGPINGAQVWSKSDTGTVAGTTVFEEAGRAIALAPGTGTAYEIVAAGGLYTGTPTGADAWLVRYAPDGTTVWSLALDGGFGLEDTFNAVAVAPSGDIYAAGRVEVAPGDFDAWIVRFNAAGTPIGQAVYSAAFMVAEEALAIAVDAASEVYVAGYVTVPGSGRNAWVSRYAADLATTPWSRSVNGAISSTDYYAGIAVDPATGAVYVAGVTANPFTYTDILVKRYDATTGDDLWTRTIDGGEGDHDLAAACALAPGGDLVVAGAVDRPTFSFTDGWLARFAPDGSTRWEVVRGTQNPYVDEALGVTVDATGVIRATGVVRGVVSANPTDPSRWLGVVDESAGPTAVTLIVPGAYAMPNPWRPGSGGVFDAAVLTIRGFTAGATVRVYTVTGAAVRELPDADRDGVVTWDAMDGDGAPVGSGVYLWAADGGSAGTARGKVVIVR